MCGPRNTVFRVSRGTYVGGGGDSWTNDVHGGVGSESAAASLWAT